MIGEKTRFTYRVEDKDSPTGWRQEVHEFVSASDDTVYEMKPGRFNERGTLMGPWVVRRRSTGKIVARFRSDGRDQAEAWIHERRKKEGREG